MRIGFGHQFSTKLDLENKSPATATQLETSRNPISLIVGTIDQNGFGATVLRNCRGSSRPKSECATTRRSALFRDVTANREYYVAIQIYLISLN
ncbi:MAG: hypothetical protein RLZZ534_1114 [Actinomycetota bacterium]